MRTGTRWTTLTKLPEALSDGRREKLAPVPVHRALRRATRKGNALAVEVEGNRVVVHDPDGFRVELVEGR
jgi:hypothetical protein